MFFDYLDGGAFSATTLRRNRAAFEALGLDQRVLRDVRRRAQQARFLGAEWQAPMALGPVGFCGMMARRGEMQAARAAGAAGIPFCLSTFSIAPLAEVAAAGPVPPMFQLYVFKDRSLSEALVEQACALGLSTLFLTVDANVSGIRERDTRNGFRTATRLGWRPLMDMALHLDWCLAMARSGPPQLGNVAGRAEMGRGLMAQASRLSAQIDPGLTWQDVGWLRRQWPGRLVVKGILSVADARAAVAAGADAIVVSNHGGRQLDGARASIEALPEIAREVGGDTEILLDSGIRRGSDIFKALALGADAVLVGRAFVYGLAADGARGVAAVLSLLAAELDIAMALTGVHNIADLRAESAALLRRLA